MKKKMFLTGMISVLLVFSLVVAACKNEPEEDPEPDPEYGVIKITNENGGIIDRGLDHVFV